jgi:pimeloyl-ACP methyl ester carboxylesterase
MVRGLLDERGIDRAILMGHSWGGTIMTAFAAAHPERVDGLVLVDSGHMDYQDAPGFPHGKSYEDLVEDARGPERTIRTTAEDFERDAQEEVWRPITPELMEAFRAGLREEGGQLVSIVTPETRASAVYGLMGTRVTESWPAIAAAGLPILLLLATEPEETAEQNRSAAEVFAERFPDAEIHFLENAGHDLFADAGPELARLVAAWAARLGPR